MFTDGIPYLSQKEQREVEEEQNQRESRAANIPEITIPPNDTANLTFVRKAREDITTWLNNPKVPYRRRMTRASMLTDPQPTEDFVNIANPGHNAIENPLNGFQRRLIYQLVRKEFPTLRVFARHQSSFMQVEKIDVEREDEVRWSLLWTR